MVKNKTGIKGAGKQAFLTLSLAAVFILAISVVSASVFTDIFHKLTGNVVEGSDIELNDVKEVGADPTYIAGLRAEFFDYTTPLSSIPNLAGKTPDVQRKDSLINYGNNKNTFSGLPANFKDTFVLRETGYIYISTSGNYIFYLKSDDGSKLYLDGNLIIDHDGIHSFVEKSSAPIALSIGYHSVKVEYFENSDSAGLILLYSGSTISKRIISKAVFFYTSVPSVCGNNVIEGGESCDGNSQSCTINGYSGVQACNAQCTGFGNCITTQSCGDGIINGNEQCEGNNLNGKTCQTHGFLKGNLTCGSGCSFDTSQCKNAVCGDGVKEGIEQCDDGNFANEDGCTSQCLIEVCNENWQCTSWGECTNEQQVRTCTDTRNCGTTINKPSVTQSCGSDAELVYSNDGSDLTGGQNGVLVANDNIKGQILSFDGVNDYISIHVTGDNSLALTTNKFSFGIWTYLTSTSPGTQLFIFRGKNGAAWGSYILSYGGTECLKNNGKYYFGFRTEGGSCAAQSVSSTAGVITNQWVQLAGTYDGSNLKLYVNGVLNNSASASGNPYDSGSAMYIGSDSGTRGTVNGRLDEIKVYNRVLSDTEIAQLANLNSVCGDGVKEGIEQCDDGNQINTDSCTNYCGTPKCGDSIIQSGEQCDDGNLFEGDGCNPMCKTESCGNNICDYHLIQGVYVAESSLTCSQDCQNAVVYGTEGSDLFQVHDRKIFVNDIEKRNVVSGEVLTLNGQGGNDIFITVGAGTKKIIGGNEDDTFWMDSTDSILDVSSSETSKKQVNIISFYYQPWTNDVNSPDYIPLESLGQDLKDPIGKDYWGTLHTNKANFAETSLFKNGMKYTDIAQGSIGNCYFLAPLTSMSNTINPQTPEIIRNAIVDIGDGTYIVRYYRPSGGIYVPAYIRVDADLYVSGGNPVFAKVKDGIWVAIMEKAYVYFATQYGGQDQGNEYNGISGGNMYDVNNQILGKTTSWNYLPSSFSLLNAQEYIANKLEPTYGTQSSTACGVVQNHAYASLYTTSNTIYSYNPWGYNHVECDINTFKQGFTYVAKIA